MSTHDAGTVSHLLAELARAGAKLRLAEDDRLEVTAPRGALSVQLRADLTRHKAELVGRLARDRSEPPDHLYLPALAADSEHLYEPFAPSDLQQAFIIGSREGFEYHVRPHQYVELDFDELDPDRFQAALNRALHRQRKNLVVAREDLLMQTVRDPAPLQVTICDLRHLPDAEAHEYMRRTRAAMERTEPPHDHWPWLRPKLTRYGGHRVRLHYNNNNLFADAPSGTGLVTDALHYYHHPDQPLPELAISFRDCALALAELEESPLGQASRQYWCARMADWPGPPKLPLRPGTGRFGRSMLSRRELLLPPQTWQAFQAQVVARGLTLTSALLGVHAEVIAYWSGSRHFLLNNMISHRSLPLHPQMSEVLGNFAALYPLEVDWRHEEPFTERVRRLQNRLLDDVAHSYWAGSKVLQTFNQVRHTPGQAVLPYAVGSALFVGPAQRPYYSMLETPQTLLDTEFWELRDGQLWVIWDVIEAMFPDGLIDAMLAGFQSLLARLADDGAAWHASAHDLLPTGQRDQRELLNRPVPVPVPGLLHDRLPHWVAQSGSKPAVISPREELSYAELHQRCEDLAGLLGDGGGRAGDLVAVILPKGADQVVAVLGALTAGAAYVPIDPDWPADRIRHLLTDTSARAVLTSESLLTRLASIAEVPVLTVDRQPARPTADHVSPPPRTADDVAYVIYTSGSTGRPKGAVLNHRGPQTTILDVNERFGVGSDDVLFGVSSLCFDLSVYDIFGALAAGATLVVPDGGPGDPASWLRMVRSHGVTVWNSVPALMELLVGEAAATGATLPSLRTVLLSGDWIPVTLPERIRQVAPNARIVSLGGATEASIWSICYPIDQHDPSWVSIPYGQPLSNQSWSVLDDQGRDAPIWTAGLLHIGGSGLALGYLGDPVRTKAAFIPHPRTGENLYRTGDLGRYLPSGDIEFLGRADFQVKVQGFRVEPGEIEATLLRHADVAQAAVLARQSGAGKQLAAFVVGPRPDRCPDPSLLRRFLADQLPDYLVPQHIVVLDELPLTANGKLDRASLHRLGPDTGNNEAEYAPPSTPTQALLAEIWELVLATTRIGIHDDFFALGGQSFAALRVLSLLTERLGYRVPLGTLLERRTIAQLADWLDSARHAWSPLVRLSDRGSSSSWFFVHPAGGNVVCYQDLAMLASRNFYAFQAPGSATGQQPLDQVAELARLYLPSLLEVQRRGPYLLGGWSSGAVIAAELARQLEELGERVERLIVIDAPAPIAPRAVAESDLVPWFVEDLGLGFDASRLSGPAADALAALPEAERLARCVALLGGPGAALDLTDLENALAVFRGVVLACSNYPAPRISADITVLRAQLQTVSEFAGHPCSQTADWGWSAITSGTVDAHALPGTHHTLLTDGDLVAAVADALNSR